MKVFVMFQAVFVLSDMISEIEADLSLTVTSPHGESTINGIKIPQDFECNAKATFSCEIKPYEDSAIWEINGETYALCVFQNCFTYPPFPENHIFIMDVASGVFNLTIDPVTNSTNNNIYKCDDGITARSVEATVKVYPNNETLTMDTTAEDRITVTTGCVYPNGIENVTFEWYISKFNITLEEEPFTSKKNESTVIFDCTETPSCTVEKTSHFNNTVIFDVSDNGEEYYIYVTVKHNDAPNRPSAVQSTKRRYKVKDKDSYARGKSTRPKDDKPTLSPKLITVIVILCVFLVQLGIMCYLQCKIHGIRIKASGGDSEISKRIGMTILGSIPVFGLILIYFTWKVFYREVYLVTHVTKTDLSTIPFRGVCLNKNETTSLGTHETERIMKHKETDKTLNSSHIENNTDKQKQSSTVIATSSSEHVGSQFRHHNNMGSIMTRGISAGTFPDVKDDMALDRLRPQPQFLKAIEKRREALKRIMAQARKEGKHVELVRGELYIDNCLYHPADNHILVHSTPHYDMSY